MFLTVERTAAGGITTTATTADGVNDAHFDPLHLPAGTHVKGNGNGTMMRSMVKAHKQHQSKHLKQQLATPLEASEVGVDSSSSPEALLNFITST